jgi:hypothetical protein
MAGFSAGRNFYAFNVGGPSFMIQAKPSFRFGFGALPSFYVLNGKTGARLGVSPRLEFGNLVLIAPFFHRESTGEWISSFGIAYRFHK